ncbi:MAG: putative RNA methyltransferase, partial [Anaerolineae bacterium]
MKDEDGILAGMSWLGVICPVCGEALIETARVLRCEQGHAFDVAREGYVNLLRWRGKPPKIVGDSAEMLRARRRFLGKGWYAPLVDLLADEVGGETAVLLDAGCGEGYYTRQMAGRWPQARIWGMDIAKTAVRLAARQQPAARFFAADVRQQIPLETASVDVILNIFSPRNADEFGRALRGDGRLLIIIPAPDHLGALRRQFDLLTIEAGKQEKITTQMSRDFELVRVR